MPLRRQELDALLSQAETAERRIAAAERERADLATEVARLRAELEPLRRAVVAQGEEVQRAQGRADRAEAAAQPVPYRPGLPSVEAVRAHDGLWMVRDADGMPDIWGLSPSDVAPGGPIHVREWPHRAEWRPCLPDGTPCPWPSTETTP